MISTGPLSISSSGQNTLTFPTPIPVTSAADYYIIFVPDPATASGTTAAFPVSFNNYANGFAFTSFYNGATPGIYSGSGPADISFVATIQPPVTNVPTLSQWGLILLGLVVLTIGTVVVWRKKYAASQIA